MKVAICISGNIRYPHIGLESIKKIVPNDCIKIFIHTWKIVDTESFLKTIFGLQSKEPDNIFETQFNFLEHYNYEKLLIEDYDESKHSEFEAIHNSINLLPFQQGACIVPRHDVGPISMHYSIYKSNQLKCDYEKENNMIFDKVIRMRFDSNFGGNELHLNNIPNGINIPRGEDWCGGINDQFAVGSSDAMNLYSNLYNHIDKIRDVQYHPETMLRKYFEMYNIAVNRFDFRVVINNR
jgi:hypothetical protein